MTNFTILTEEVGEMARYISRIYGEQSFKNPEDEITAKNNLKDEMADVLFVLCCLANQMNIDLEDAMKENMQKKTQRDKLRHIANEKLKG
ncbi:MAG: pyrophosphatase [Saprospiraceae bacterium]|nr:pyrophosphatase [Saprospiraceae bacterium]MBK9993853.1 pyrophosphatase [Saprospiraceae bacterium]